MQMAAITKPGLAVIAILVAVLWGCLVSERLTVQKADREMGQTLLQMRETWRRQSCLPRPDSSGRMANYSRRRPAV